MKNIVPTHKLNINIINLFGERGQKWLNDLPNIVAELASHWQLISILPVANMTYNYVAKAVYQDQPVVLKISCDETSIMTEKKALNYFDGHASIKLIDYHEHDHALLLEQAIPGNTLKSLYPEDVAFVMDRYVETMNKLHFKPVPLEHSFRHISDWLKAFDRTTPDHLPKELLHKAITLKEKLLLSLSKPFVLHGDLHHDNIIKHYENWLTIDPKGIVGEPEFEIAAFDFISDKELESKKNLSKLFNSRIELLAEKTTFDPQRIKDWVFVRLILSAAWAIEDNSDPACAINLARLI